MMRKKPMLAYPVNNKPVDYSKNNVDYCGMEMTTTPYEFKK